MKSLSQAEVVSVIKAAKSTRDKTMIAMSFRHGLRCSEVCNLKISDLDLRNNQVKIRRLKGSLETVQPIVDQVGTPELSEKRLLNAWLRERGDNASPYVFISQKSGKLNRSTFFRVFNEAAAAAGIPEDRRHPHTLKHSLAVALVNANVNLAIVRVALGHKNISSTCVYAVPSDAQAGVAVQRALLALG